MYVLLIYYIDCIIMPTSQYRQQQQQQSEQDQQSSKSDHTSSKHSHASSSVNPSNNKQTIFKSSLDDNIRLQQFITSLQSYLITSTTLQSSDYVKSMNILRPREYDEICETRNADHMCAYIGCCNNIDNNNTSNSGKYRLSLYKQIVYDTCNSYIYCSPLHQQQSRAFRNKLNDLPLNQRIIAYEILDKQNNHDKQQQINIHTNTQQQQQQQQNLNSTATNVISHANNNNNNNSIDTNSLNIIEHDDNNSDNNSNESSNNSNSSKSRSAVTQSNNDCYRTQSESLDACYDEYKKQQKAMGNDVDESIVDRSKPANLTNNTATSIQQQTNISTQSNTQQQQSNIVNDQQKQSTKKSVRFDVDEQPNHQSNTDDAINMTGNGPSESTQPAVVGMLEYDEQTNELTISSVSNIEAEPDDMSNILADQLFHIAQTHPTTINNNTNILQPTTQSTTQPMGSLTRKQRLKRQQQNAIQPNNVQPINKRYFTTQDIQQRITERMNLLDIDSDTDSNASSAVYSDIDSDIDDKNDNMTGAEIMQQQHDSNVTQQMLHMLMQWCTTQTADLLLTYNNNVTYNTTTTNRLHVKHISNVYNGLKIKHRCNEQLQQLVNTFNFDTSVPTLTQSQWSLLNTVLLYAISKSQYSTNNNNNWFPSSDSHILISWCNKLNITINNLQTLHNALLYPI